MKHRFFAPPDSVSGDTIVFPPDEAHHAVRVLRVKTGEMVSVVDGEGSWYRAELEVIGRKNLVGRILERRTNDGEPAFDLTLCVSPLKNTSRFEWIVEKASELGVRRLVPLLSKRTERSRIKRLRMETISITAMKQCGRSRVLQIDEPQKFQKLMKESDDTDELKILCHEAAPTDASLIELLSSPDMLTSARILIGPEGGFTDEEVEAATGKGFKLVSLGERRLRTETAAICASSIVMSGVR